MVERKFIDLLKEAVQVWEQEDVASSASQTSQDDEVCSWKDVRKFLSMCQAALSARATATENLRNELAVRQKSSEEVPVYGWFFNARCRFGCTFQFPLQIFTSTK